MNNLHVSDIIRLRRMYPHHVRATFEIGQLTAREAAQFAARYGGEKIAQTYRNIKTKRQSWLFGFKSDEARMGFLETMEGGMISFTVSDE